MRFKISRNISILVILVLIISLLPVYGATQNLVDRVPPVRTEHVFDADFKPTLYIEEARVGEFNEEPQRIRLILENAEWVQDGSIQTDLTHSTGADFGNVSFLGNKIMNITLEPEIGATEVGWWGIPLYSEIIGGPEAKITIDSLGSAVTGGTYPFAEVVNVVVVEPEPEEEVEEPEEEVEEPEETVEPAEPEKPQVSFTVGQTGYIKDGQRIESDIAPYIQPTEDGLGRIMVPVRFVSMAIGADNVMWDGDQRIVTVIKEEVTLQLSIGSTTLYVNGQAELMDTPAEIIDIGDSLGRTMIPVAHLARALGVEYQWDEDTETVIFYY